MTYGEDAMIDQPEGAMTVRVPKNPDERLALDIIQAVWPMLSYVRDAPPKLGMQVTWPAGQPWPTIHSAMSSVLATRWSKPL